MRGAPGTERVQPRVARRVARDTAAGGAVFATANGTAFAGGAVLPGGYEPRAPSETVLHQVVRTHLGRFLADTRAATDGTGLPRFVEREFRDFLGCGRLERGFARVRCDACRFERLVPFSCKARAICPSCGGRRMAEQAAHLVDAVLPWVPVRQWVLTVPHRLRYRLAFDHPLCRTVLGVFVRTVLGWYRRRARRAGIADGRSGTITVVQRFGSGLELNVHFHVLGLDGVFAPAADGTVRFHRLAPPTDADVARLVTAIARRIGRLLVRRGLAMDADAVKDRVIGTPESSCNLPPSRLMMGTGSRQRPASRCRVWA